MVKTNKKSVVALIVMALLLVASLVLGATGAWFTGSANVGEDKISFGKIDIAVTDSVAATAVSKTGTGYNETTEALMPGDTLKINYTIQNNANAAWILSYVSVTVEGKTGDSISLLTGWYAATGNTQATNAAGAIGEAEETIDPTTSKVTYGTAVEQAFEHSVLVDGKVYGNDYELLTVTITVNVFAVQQENMTAEDAYTFITTNCPNGAANDTFTSGVAAVVNAD